MSMTSGPVRRSSAPTSRPDHRSASRADRLIGRADSLAELERLLAVVEGGHFGALELVGEAGIGKTRLLAELTARADDRGHLVLAGAASEFERDEPFAVVIDALDQFLAGLDPQVFARFDDQVRTELAAIFPSLHRIGSGRGVPQHERYRSYRAVRVVIEELGRNRPLVLILDDLHWADPASVELLESLLRRPPAASVLLAVALRPVRGTTRLAAALDRAHRAASLVRVPLGPLSAADSRQLVGPAVPEVSIPWLCEESGGNPFYLLELARSLERSNRPGAPVGPSIGDIGVPLAVAAALREELGRLTPDERLVFEAAAVAGDPFESDLAAAAAGRSEADTLDAVDELVRLDLVRVTDVPRRFRFRHPLVRRAAYAGTAAAWRLGAHERCAAALADRGASALARAHHVERSARPGDLVAVATLAEAGRTAARLAPDSAATWFDAALRLLPDNAPTRERSDLLLARGWALAAVGRFGDSHAAVLDAINLVQDEPPPQVIKVTTACASVERFLGRYEDAHARLIRALDRLGDAASADRAELLIELTLNEFYRSRYGAMHPWAVAAADAANGARDQTLVAAAAVMRAFADAMAGPPDRAGTRGEEAAAIVDGLPDEELCRRPDVAGWLAIAEVYVDRYADADVHASRALRLGRATGQGDPLHRLYPVLPRVWYVRGKLTEAAELLDGAIEASRLLGSPPALAGNLFNRSAIALAAGDLDVAVATAEEAVALTRGLDPGFVPAWAAVRLANVLFEIGQPLRALELIEARAGGFEAALIPGSWQAYALDLVVRCALTLDRPADARVGAQLAHVAAAASGLRLASAWADRAAAAVALATGDAGLAADLALASAESATVVGAPIEAALSRVLAGTALAELGNRGRAVAELHDAAAALDACGANRFRDRAERELGRLGERPHRRSRRGAVGSVGLGSLTGRELEVALLVVDRRTNAEIAGTLFLSPKTVETHLRNIFNKLGVSNRAELGRKVERHNGHAAEPREPGPTDWSPGGHHP